MTNDEKIKQLEDEGYGQYFSLIVNTDMDYLKRHQLSCTCTNGIDIFDRQHHKDCPRYKYVNEKSPLLKYYEAGYGFGRTL